MPTIDALVRRPGKQVSAAGVGGAGAVQMGGTDAWRARALAATPSALASPSAHVSALRSSPFDKLPFPPPPPYRYCS